MDKFAVLATTHIGNLKYVSSAVLPWLSFSVGNHGCVSTAQFHLRYSAAAPHSFCLFAHPSELYPSSISVFFRDHSQLFNSFLYSCPHYNVIICHL